MPKLLADKYSKNDSFDRLEGKTIAERKRIIAEMGREHEYDELRESMLRKEARERK